jgi:beta-xylosidase
VFRSTKIEGPYEARIVLAQGRTTVNGPHQGAWVDTPQGEHWFVHFQDRGAYGRVVHLQPMRWGDDGWPSMGTAGEGGIGQPVSVHRKPVAGQLRAAPAATDEFLGPALGLQWQWQANPQPHWANLKPAGGLRLRSGGATGTSSLWDAPALLLQKFSAPAFTATTEVSLVEARPGDTAGLVVFGCSHAWLGLREAAVGVQLVLSICEDAYQGGRERECVCMAAPARRLQLRVEIAEEARCTFSCSVDGRTFVPLAPAFTATVSKWVGAKVGLFARAGADGGREAEADFAWFHVAPPA